MPTLDVSEVLFDPDFADLVTVQRHAQSVNGNGEAVLETVTYPNIVAVITSESAGELIKRDDGQQHPRKVSVVTVFRLRGASTGFSPDDIIFNGTKFTVTEVLPFSRFGSGFVEVIATFMGFISAPTT